MLLALILANKNKLRFDFTCWLVSVSIKLSFPSSKIQCATSQDLMNCCPCCSDLQGIIEAPAFYVGSSSNVLNMSGGLLAQKSNPQQEEDMVKVCLLLKTVTTLQWT